MATLLSIKASPRGARSHSCAVADAFVHAWQERHPSDEIITLDLFRASLPPFDATAVNAKYTVMHQQQPTDDELRAWQSLEAVIRDFKAADAYVFAVPMWNFGIPYRLKQYLDILIQPGLTFGFSPETGFQGLVTGKRAFVSYARGGEYLPGTDGEEMDFQRPHFEAMLRFIGITDIRAVVVEPTLAAGPETAQQRQAMAIERARQMAAEF